MKILFAVVSASALTLCAARGFAGDFQEENGVALNRFDALSYFASSPDPLLGVRDRSYTYQGSKFYFVTSSHEQAFAANPQAYAPQFDGYCAYEAAQGRKVAAQPRVFAVVNGKLYMFSDAEARKNWKKDVAGNVARATEQWADVSKLAMNSR